MTDEWEQSEQNANTWDSFPSYPVPVMQHAARDRSARVYFSPISNNLVAFMPLVMADLSESQ